uniref:Radical SAM domain protein n=1 Tax=Nitratidesulfovibrio vulgaris (strain DSM 19637 / Miyazaki F) TaxID=883 RepID=B8DRX1_NITV9
MPDSINVAASPDWPDSPDGPGHTRGAACASTAPPRRRPRILPVFLPFAGCPTRCVFCAQDVQTGQRGGINSVGHALAVAEARLEHEARLLEAVAVNSDQETRDHPAPNAGRVASAHEASPSPLEIAFYGGTFTLLSEAERAACLELAARWRQRGVVCRVRCSTRPDAVTEHGLTTLRAAGMDCVELGVQSFDDAALVAASRGYGGALARAACAMVAGAGLELGVQLMPGMPGVTPEVFRTDVRTALLPDTDGAAPLTSFLRFYPCLVLRGTPLAERWRAGSYVTWSLDTTVDALADGLLAAWARGVAVVRMGLSPEDGLDDAVLAGPMHPALGQLAKAEALRRHVAAHLARLPGPPVRLGVPRRLRGLLWGHANGLVDAYAAMGITRDMVHWRDDDTFSLE